MNTLAFIVFSAFYTHGVLCSFYHGPTAAPTVLHNGYLEDTHEVALAKNAHLATLSQQSHYGGYLGHKYNLGGEHGASQESNEITRYHGPTAVPHVLHDGHIADTHEVAAAKAEHFAAVAKAQVHGGYADYSGNKYASGYDAHSSGYHGHSYNVAPYHGPLARPLVLKSGYLADTHEVSAAKAEHLAAVAKAQVHGGYGYKSSGRYASGHGSESETYYGQSYHVAPYHGPLARPLILKSGYLADTHEVSAAKAEHLAAVAKAQVHGGYGYESSGRYASGHGSDSDTYYGQSYHVAPYHGPLAKPVVLKSGYLADTHEVAAAKQHHIHLLHSGSQYGIH